jgi:hypothetical protein
MKKLFTLLPIVAVMAACSSVPKDPYERQAYEQNARQEKYVDRAIDQAPKWMTELPKSTSAIYASGSAVSSDLGMADEKAKLMAVGKVCMSAGGEVDKQSKLFRADVGEQSTENSEMAIRAMCRTVDISGVEIAEVKRISEGAKFRTYILVALPVGEANAIQKRKDGIAVQKRAEARSTQAFTEMDAKNKEARPAH